MLVFILKNLQLTFVLQNNLLDGCVFECVVELIVAGHPICIECCEGRWISFGESESVGYSYVTCAKNLDETMECVRCHLTDLRRMLCGLEEAKHRLAGT